MSKKVTLINAISNTIHQIISVISGFVIPQIILRYFGSNVNGLVSSLAQILSYVSLLEGGITGVIKAKLYKPLYEKKYKTISSIVKTTSIFYKKIAYVFILYSFVVSFFYPIIFDTDFSYIFVFTLSILLAMNVFIQYMFSLTYKTLLIADKKGYIVSLTQSLILILNILLAYISVHLFPSIHLLKIITALLFLLQPIIFNYFIKKYYCIDKNAEINNDLLKSRWNGFAINIAAFIHNSTDITILTIFASLSTVSIYGIYALVASGIKIIITSVSSAISPSVGHIYASNNTKNLNKVFDLYEFVLFFMAFLFFSVAWLLIIPFITIYTNGVTDAVYLQPVFGRLLLIAELLYLIKEPHVELSYAADKFKEITIHCYIEAAINIIVSIILVQKYGLVGVAIGTILAMMYRLIFHVWFSKKYLIHRSQWKFYKKIIIYFLSSALGLFICSSIIPSFSPNIVNWIKNGMIYFTIMFSVLLSVSYIFYKDEIMKLVKYLKKSK